MWPINYKPGLINLDKPRNTWIYPNPKALGSGGVEISEKYLGISQLITNGVS